MSNDTLYTLKIDGVFINCWVDFQLACTILHAVMDSLVFANARCQLTLEQCDATPSVSSATVPSNLVLLFDARIADGTYQIPTCNLVYDDHFKVTAPVLA